jgi:hypothetical protein
MPGITFPSSPLDNPSCLLALIANLHSLETDTSDGTPPISQAQARYLTSCAQACVSDVTDTLELLGELIGSACEQGACEEVLLQYTGGALRLLSGVLRVSERVAERAEDAGQHYAHAAD